jgi:hypothetical protein
MCIAQYENASVLNGGFGICHVLLKYITPSYTNTLSHLVVQQVVM